ncbi:hypothetical protein A0H81_00892 [Grifola frondosa]|uniref:DUF3955 domain-containing protein n=1 Tax=Grifola frondosa TaxID=5627 RepID=A0A1C7MT26_GRIFR|nr:hypothetical protein A0H81_00892 [Grifola frondosa]
MPDRSSSHTNIEMDAVSAPPQPGARGKSRSRTRAESRKDYITGICLLLVVVVLWTSSNFLTQDLYEDGYEKPFLVTYLNTSAFALYLLPFVIRQAAARYNGYQVARLGGGSRSGYEPLVTDAVAAEVLGSTTPEPQETPIHQDITDFTQLAPLNTHQTAQLAAVFCFLWFIANWTVNASLDYTSVASATILSSMSGFFTLGIGRIFRVETLTIVKIGAVATSFAGVILVSLSDSSLSQPSQPSSSPGTPSAPLPSMPVLGDILALLSALFYALYVTLLKVRIRSESRIDMQLFFGFVGLFNILSCWPIGIILHLTGVERLELPHTSKTVIALLINMGITLSSDYIYVLAMLKTTPLVVTVGLSLTMPLAVLGDFLLQKPTRAQVIIGAAIVLLSFVAVGMEDSRNEEEEDLLSGERLDEEEGQRGFNWRRNMLNPTSPIWSIVLGYRLQVPQILFCSVCSVHKIKGVTDGEI